MLIIQTILLVDSVVNQLKYDFSRNLIFDRITNSKILNGGLELDAWGVFCHYTSKQRDGAFLRDKYE